MAYRLNKLKIARALMLVVLAILFLVKITGSLQDKNKSSIQSKKELVCTVLGYTLTPEVESDDNLVGFNVICPTYSRASFVLMVDRRTENFGKEWGEKSFPFEIRLKGDQLIDDSYQQEVYKLDSPILGD